MKPYKLQSTVLELLTITMYICMYKYIRSKT